MSKSAVVSEKKQQIAEFSALITLLFDLKFTY